MGGLSSFATTALQTLSFANEVISGIDSYQKKSGSRAYEQAKEKSALELANMKAQGDLQKAKIQAAQSADNEERRQKLRAALATKRAIFGAKGIGSSSGSPQAYLLGLTEASADEEAREEAMSSLSSRIIDQKYDQKQAVNTLRLTQLKEQNKLKRVNALYDTIF